MEIFKCKNSTNQKNSYDLPIEVKKPGWAKDWGSSIPTIKIHHIILKI
jgi:hypothetical protein